MIAYLSIVPQNISKFRKLKHNFTKALLQHSFSSIVFGPSCIIIQERFHLTLRRKYHKRKINVHSLTTRFIVLPQILSNNLWAPSTKTSLDIIND